MADLTRTVADDDPARRANEALLAFGDSRSSARLDTRETTDDHPAQAGSEPLLAAGATELVTPADERYVLQRQAGQGGGGEVYIVEDRHLGRTIAAKVQHVQHADDAQRRLRFADEARITASLEHPGILPVYDLAVGRDGRTYYTMRQADGRGLDEIIAGQPASPTDRVELLLKACDAVAYAHSRGIIHRDLKPANIMVGRFGEVVVLDWGSAVRADAAPARAAGTPLYMSPEQARGEAADTRSDVYSLGATLRELLTGAPPMSLDGDADFWELKRRGHTEPWPANAHIPASLVEIVDLALAADPTRRPADAAALAELLRSWLRNQQAEALLAEAERRLTEDENDLSDQRWQHHVDAFQRIQADGSLTRRVARGRSQALAGRAQAAIRRGDLALARQLIVPEASDAAGLAERLEAAVRQRRWRQRLIWAALVLALVLALAGGLAAWRDTQDRVGSWQEVWSWDSSSAALPELRPETPITLDSARHFRDAQGRLVIDAPLTYWLPASSVGEVRLTVDLTWPEERNGFDLLIRGGHERLNNIGVSPRGFGGQFAGYDGTWCSLWANRQPNRPPQVQGVSLPFQADRRHRLQMTFADGLLRLEADGTTVLTSEPPPLVVGPGQDRFGICSWAKRVAIHAIRIERRNLPRRPNPMVFGDQLVVEGFPAAALRTYERIAAEHPDLAEEAVAKAHFTAGMDDQLSSQREALFARLTHDWPASTWIVRCQLDQVRMLWQKHRHAEALDLAEIVLRQKTETSLAADLMSEEAKLASAPDQRRLLGLLARIPRLARMDLGNLQGITDLAPLRGKDLRWLTLRKTAVEDLEPLRGMSLLSLDISNTPVSDLSPLQGMRLTWLIANRTRIHDLHPLAGMPLRSFDAAQTAISDLSPLQGMPLSRLNIADTPATDHSFLRGLPLRHLDASRTSFSDLRIVRQPGLRTLVLARTPVSDLAPLAGLDLWHLNVDQTAITSLAPLAGIPLTSLSLASTRISDLRPLAGMPLQKLDLRGSPATDLRPLAGLPLAHIFLDTPGIDLRPLTGCPISWLHLVGDRCDLAPLEQMPQIKSLVLAPALASSTDVGSLLAHWQGTSATATAIRSVRCAALGDAAGLRRLGSVQAGRRRSLVPFPFGYDDAVALAGRLGGRLACIRDETDQAHLRALVPASDTCWLGLEPAADGWRWADGRPESELVHADDNLRLSPERCWGFWNVPDRLNWIPYARQDPEHRVLLVVEWDED